MRTGLTNTSECFGKERLGEMDEMDEAELVFSRPLLSPPSGWAIASSVVGRAPQKIDAQEQRVLHSTATGTGKGRERERERKGQGSTGGPVTEEQWEQIIKETRCHHHRSCNRLRRTDGGLTEYCVQLSFVPLQLCCCFKLGNGNQEMGNGQWEWEWEWGMLLNLQGQLGQDALRSLYSPVVRTLRSR